LTAYRRTTATFDGMDEDELPAAVLKRLDLLAGTTS
jgi:hypothetical protein